MTKARRCGNIDDHVAARISDELDRVLDRL